MSDAEGETAANAGDERDLGELLTNATDAIDSLEARFADVDGLETLSDDALESVLGDVEALTGVADELGDLFETLDMAELREAIEGEEVLEAIHAGQIPETLADGDEGLGEIVDVSQLIGALNLLDAWNGADLSQLWQDVDELGDAVDDTTDDSGDGLASRAAAAVSGDDGDGLLDEDSRLTDEEGDVFDTEMEDLRGSFDVASDPEAYQTFIQQQAFKGIDEFRDALLRVHGKFEQLYEFNREKMRRQDTSTNSRNPTAVSTIPTDRQDLGGGARYSTVPQKVKYSTAPSRKRIYGRRFELERKRRGYD